LGLELGDFVFEYVTGVLRIPPIGDPARVVVPILAVTNAGPIAGHTRALVYRTRRSEVSDDGFDLVLDSAMDNGVEGSPIPDLVPPGKTWFWAIGDWSATVGGGTFWFSIRTTSPSLVPSIAFHEEEPSGEFLQSLELRYVPGDFAALHHRFRAVTGVVVPHGGPVIG
jgi:hypothetical protein